MIGLALNLLGIYCLAGLVFGVVFAFVGAKEVDPGAVGGSTGFKLVIIPGCVVFWPLLLTRWLRRRPLPTERSAHRVSP